MKQAILLTLLAFSSSRLTVRAFKEMPEQDKFSLNEFYGLEGDLGQVDAPMRNIKGDGRDPETRSYFEEMRLMMQGKADEEHPVLKAPAQDADVNMYMMMDWNHVIDVRLRKANQDLAIIPDMEQHDFILMHPNCTDCHSMRGSTW